MKAKSILCISLIAGMFFTSCNKPEPEQADMAVTGVSLDKNQISLVEGETAVLTATVAPEDATNKNVSWSSSNTEVATVEAGTVTAIAEGEAVITVTTEDGGLTAECAVTVTASTVSVEGVALDKTELEITEGETAVLTATVTPENATNVNVSWSSSNTEVATVDGGTVTAVAEGEAVITVTTEDGGKTAECAVTVVRAAIHVDGVTLDKTELEMTEGDVETLTATVTPADADNKNVSWSSSNTSVATVEGGTVTAVAEGEAVITVTTEDGGLTAECTVTVAAKSAITIEGNTYTNDYIAFGGEGVQLSANTDVTWSSSDETVATVDASGYVRFLNDKDDVTVTITAADGSGETAAKEFHCYQSVPYINSTAYPDGTVEVPTGMRNFYLKYNDGANKVDNSLYEFVIGDETVMSAYKDEMTKGLGVKGLQSGATTTLTITFNSGLVMELNIVVE